jgi:hypothetical protein
MTARTFLRARRRPLVVQASFWSDLNPLHRQFARAALLQHGAM